VPTNNFTLKKWLNTNAKIVLKFFTFILLLRKFIALMSVNIPILRNVIPEKKILLGRVIMLVIVLFIGEFLPFTGKPTFAKTTLTIKVPSMSGPT
jgi:hypothetical protein